MLHPLDPNLRIRILKVNGNLADPVSQGEIAEGLGDLRDIKHLQGLKGTNPSPAIEGHNLREQLVPQHMMLLVIRAVQAAEVKSCKSRVLQELVHLKTSGIGQVCLADFNKATEISGASPRSVKLVPYKRIEDNVYTTAPGRLKNALEE
ncbi:hypothetical protein O1611_g5688 [Lasiodiplodia mahajangana]|uniref:Uncharacterized protein n=1 Tax=Lasiodiplodia mahajangana TaxID=1108764 RepID=A0ACC2JL20_9PEZI|nr:hypothetical protein O1611_g5688 [Lasiodiplodia mahajangana]